MEPLNLAKDLIKSCLQQGDNVNGFTKDTKLLGAFPELNSLTIMTMITALEEQLDCEIADEELSAEIFETVGTLAQFIEKKM